MMVMTLFMLCSDYSVGVARVCIVFLCGLYDYRWCFYACVWLCSISVCFLLVETEALRPTNCGILACPFFDDDEDGDVDVGC